MEQHITIRDFHAKNDIDALTALTNELGYPTTKQEMELRMLPILKNHDYRTMVAVKDDVVVGYIGMFRCLFWERNGCFIRVQSLVVSKTQKRFGIGRRLIEEAKIWAHETGALTISLNCGHKEEREGAHQFYPGIGFVASAVGYTKEMLL